MYTIPRGKESMTNESKMQRPIDDPDSHFVAIRPDNTAAVMAALREARVQFDVAVTPNRGQGEADCDVFWFWRTQDTAVIQAAINKGLKK